MPRTGRPEKLTADHLALATALIESNPSITLAELTRVFCEQSKLTVHSATLQKALKRHGIERRRKAVEIHPAQPVVKTCDYRDHPRQSGNESPIRAV